MVSITSRLYPTGRVSWRVQFRIDGRLKERCFRERAEADHWASQHAPLRDPDRRHEDRRRQSMQSSHTPSRRHKAHVIEEVSFLIDQGLSSDAICAALEMTPGAVQKACYRADRHDLARRIEVR